MTTAPQTQHAEASHSREMHFFLAGWNGAVLNVDATEHFQRAQASAPKRSAARTAGARTGYVLADQAYSLQQLHEDLQDVWREANAVDTAIGRPDALMKKLTRICDAVANAANGYLPVALTPAARDVLSERHRQINAEGWTPEHDDAYNRGVLAEAGGIYALHAFDPRRLKEVPEGWPWDDAWWKPSESSRRNLEKAAALILAEIERIDRAIEEAKRGAA